MDTIHPPTISSHSSPATCHSSPERASLRPFSTQLAAYTKYALMVVDLRFRARSVRAMGRALENNIPLRLARAAAQLELQSVYDHIAFGLGLPSIPVRLPLRKRVRAAGLASFLGDTPREIRIFPITGHAEKIRRHWRPTDLGISPPALVCEILLHETAHIRAGILTKTRHYGPLFIHNYSVVERVMLGLGFGPLLPDYLRFAGCPPQSSAALLQGTPRPAY